MSITLNAEIIVEIQQRLIDDLPGHLAAVNAEDVDGGGAAHDIVMPTEQDIYDYTPATGELNTFPSLGVGDGRSLFEDDIGSSATGNHEVLVVAYEQEGDQRTLSWKLRRWNQAVVRTVLAGRRLDSAAWGTTLVGVRPGPTLGDDPENPRTWTSWSGVVIRAKRDEE